MAFAVEPEAGKIYPGKTAIEVPTLGVSFVIPDGWEGVLPPQQSVFMMAKEGIEVQLFIAVDKMTMAEVQGHLSQPSQVSEGVFMEPTAAPLVKGNKVSGTFQVTGSPQELSAKAFAIVGEHGVSVIIMALHTEAGAAHVGQVTAQVEQSLKITKLQPLKSSGFWHDQLKGKQLVRFNNKNGSSDKEQFYFCSDGRFKRTFHGGAYSNSVNGTLSMASRDGNVGRWAATGGEAGSAIVLQNEDGTQGQLTIARVDGKVMVNGTRWFIDTNDICQ
ncbi:MAG: hypothetical protein H0U74_18510 [Bradymonadaceae bacterium]|nr:hypothetical protein [Lujinxingiaceae bacterium]